MVKQKRKKQRTHVEGDDSGVPKSFVMHTGEVGHALEGLIRDIRSVMEPYTASKLKVRRQNVLKDFVNVAGPLGISHFLIFSQGKMGANLRLARLPRGPTITFRVSEYSLKADVLALQRRPHSPSTEYKYPALLVLNNFPKESFHMKLIVTMFQNMFPSINVEKVNLNQVRRCVLVNYDKEKNVFEFRHYLINVRAAGVSRSVKKIIQARIPNLSNLDDIADYVMSQGAGLSDSEAEDPEDAKVVLPQKVHGVGNTKSQQSAIKLQEQGPRMTLTLIKIEEGFCTGNVLHHEFVQKTPEEVEALRKFKEQQQREKTERKKKQEENVKKKQKQKEEHKKRCAPGQAGDGEDGGVSSGSEDSDGYVSADDQPKFSDDDDAEYYRQEVGENPDPDLFDANRTGKKKSSGTDRPKIPSRYKAKAKGESGAKKGQKRQADGHGDGPAAKKFKKDQGGAKGGLKGSKKFGAGKGSAKASPGGKPKVSGFIRKRKGK
eukprot:comp23243_c0_seq1/m.37945 comp23243_c0_seq1/g.37945  ORF comp23243_c0_seq1/g.37945 comp23243_c0_seq1/m.37945 type:complete len:490 (-) comp23243_c0_seq1:345-1814(-)